MALPDGAPHAEHSDAHLISLALVTSPGDSVATDSQIGRSAELASAGFMATVPSDLRPSAVRAHHPRRAVPPPSAEPAPSAPAEAPSGASSELEAAPSQVVAGSANSDGAGANAFGLSGGGSASSMGGGGSARGAAGFGAHARLLARGEPCRGFFPARASSDHGIARVIVQVGADGKPRAVRLLSEWPRAEGFGDAALACAVTLTFAPARSVDGERVDDEAKLELSFEHG